MSKELIGGPDGALSTLIIDSSYVSCIDSRPTLESHQRRRDEEDAEHDARLAARVVEAGARIANNAVETLQSYAAELEPYGERTKPPSWFHRKYIRWSCKLKAIFEIIKE